MKRSFFDIPPAWTSGAVALLWVQSRLWPLAVPGWLVVIGWALVALGVALMLAAAGQMMVARTTVWPHGRARHLVTGGVFSFSRNPIYLGDALVVAGAGLILAAPLAVFVLPGFIFLIQKRFIEPEENRLAGDFGAGFAEYCRRTRRWI